MTRGRGRYWWGALPEDLLPPDHASYGEGADSGARDPPSRDSFLLRLPHRPDAFCPSRQGDSNPGPRAPLVQPLRRAGPGRPARARSSAGDAAWARAMCPPEIFSSLVRRRPGGLLKAAAKDEGGENCACPLSVGMSRSSIGNAASSSAAHLRRPEQPRGVFSEDQFLAISRELVSPGGRPDASWQLLTNVQGLCIYRLFDEKSGLYEYKIYSILTDCSPELCAEVYMDLNYRTKWDQYVKNVREKTQDGKTAIYWEVKFPFPLANRDYVFVRERRDTELDGQKIYVILAKSVNTVKFSEKPGIVRAKNYKQGVAFASDGKKGCKVFMTYFDDPGGRLPSWVVNWAVKTGVPNFLKDMQKACHSYRKR